MEHTRFLSEKESLLEEAGRLEDIADRDAVEETAETLERYNYAPTLLWPINLFTRMDREKLLRVMREAAEAPEKEFLEYGFSPDEDLDEKRILQMRALLNHYRFLLRLRAGEAEAWEEFNELYEDD